MYTPPHAAGHDESHLDPLSAEIITIGDELNRGEITDTNSAWIAEQLTEQGFLVRFRHGTGDREDDISALLSQAAGRVRVAIVCGGLGPTSDDVTVDTVAAMLSVPPIAEPEHEARVRTRFAERGMPLTDNNLRQVRIPQGAEVLPNLHGLAPGFVVKMGMGTNRAELYFMPGVPREMKPMFQGQVLPRLRLLAAGAPKVARRTYRVLGLGEGLVDHHLRDLLPTLGTTTIHYRLAFPEVLVTLVSHGDDEAAAQAALDRLDPQIRQRLGRAVYSEGPDDLPIVLGRVLRQRTLTVATAESCTGGMIGELLSAVPGASAYFVGGVISYANEVKHQLLGVREETLLAHGAVSQACVEEMAQGVRRLTQASYGVAVSGIAGPDGGTPDKPVGTVHLAVAAPDGQVTARKVFWPGDRQQVRRVAAYAALNLLYHQLTPLQETT